MKNLEGQAAQLEDLVSQLRDDARDLRDQEKTLDQLWATELAGPIIDDRLPEVRSLSTQLGETYARVDRLVHDLVDLVAFADRICGDAPDEQQVGLRHSCVAGISRHRTATQGETPSTACALAFRRADQRSYRASAHEEAVLPVQAETWPDEGERSVEKHARRSEA